MVKKPTSKYIKINQSVFIAGRTGCGKTYLAKKYLANYPFVVALDTKGMLKWEEVPKKDLTIVTNLADLPKATTPKIIYRPSFTEMNLESYNEFFKWVYFRENCIVWVDEVMGVCPNSSKIPEYYKAILTRGREKNTACWSLTQRPLTIPAVVISESLHVFVFQLNMEQDREKIANITGYNEFKRPPQAKFQFWYLDLTGDEVNSPVLGILDEKKA